MKTIGGYFELELRKGREYHKGTIRLNSGRNAFEYILRSRKYNQVLFPYYMCDVLLEPVKKLGLDYKFYHINESFEPVLNPGIIKKNEAFLYINYFGICDHLVQALPEKFPSLIIDNSQAFFSKPVSSFDTFYSPRKFFGVPDGGYLFTDKKLQKGIEKGTSGERIKHLVKRMESGAQSGFDYFLENEKAIGNQPVMKMSVLTESLLRNIDYNAVREKRTDNFKILHEYLRGKNKIQIPVVEPKPALAYPFLPERKGLRQHLRKHNILIPVYWPNVLKWVKSKEIEYKFADEIIALPVDQRYSLKDMNRIINTVLSYV
jgi:hypothetical protein